MIIKGLKLSQFCHVPVTVPLLATDCRAANIIPGSYRENVAPPCRATETILLCCTPKQKAKINLYCQALPFAGRNHSSIKKAKRLTQPFHIVFETFGGYSKMLLKKFRIPRFLVYHCKVRIILFAKLKFCVFNSHVGCKLRYIQLNHITIFTFNRYAVHLFFGLVNFQNYRMVF